MEEPEYPVALWPWSEHGRAPEPLPTFDGACNESWFIAQGLAEPPRANSEAVSAESYTQDAEGKWRQAKGSTGKGGISLG